jgi:hypothetical protein
LRLRRGKGGRRSGKVRKLRDDDTARMEMASCNIMHAATVGTKNACPHVCHLNLGLLLIIASLINTVKTRN